MEIRTANPPTGISLEYMLTGPTGADTLCFVHGLGSNLRQFEAQAAHFSDRYRHTSRDALLFIPLANMEQPAAFNEILATFLTETVMTNHQGES